MLHVIKSKMKDIIYIQQIEITMENNNVRHGQHNEFKLLLCFKILPPPPQKKRGQLNIT